MKIKIVSLKHGTHYVLVDNEDMKFFDQTKLYLHRIGQFLYVKLNPSKKTLHSVIMKTPKGMVTDHINRDTLDNRRKNLRICTIQENLRNQKRPNNKTGHTGISIQYISKGNTQKCKKHTIYQASIKTNYKQVYLGIFHTLDEAVQARRNAELKFWGRSYT
jgi:hypothetical protein